MLFVVIVKVTFEKTVEFKIKMTWLTFLKWLFLGSEGKGNVFINQLCFLIRFYFISENNSFKIRQEMFYFVMHVCLLGRKQTRLETF